MTSLFPNGLDSIPCPSGSDKLNIVPHAELHCSTSLAVEALQFRVGVTGSNVATTIDYELHNTSHGHDHDGINSRPVAVGPDCNGLSGSGSYSNGFFTDFSGSTRVGCAIDKINQALGNLTLSGSASLLALESQDSELTANAVRINLSGSGVSGTLVSPGTVKYTIPGVDYRQLIFLADCGPFEHESSPMIHDFIYFSPPFVSASIWWTDVTRTQKIVEKIYTRNGRKQATQIVYNVYENDGITVKTKVTDIVTYSGVLEVSRSRTVT